MKNSIISLLALQIAFSSVFLPSAHVAKADLVEDTCKKTPNYGLCTSTLQSDPRSSSARDVGALAVIAAQKLDKDTKATQKQIESLVKTYPQYKTCVESYTNVVNYDMVEILQATPGNPKFAVAGASDVATEADTCGKSIRSLKSDVVGSNKLVHDLSLVLLAIVKLLL